MKVFQFKKFIMSSALYAYCTKNIGNPKYKVPSNYI